MDQDQDQNQAQGRGRPHQPELGDGGHEHVDDLIAAYVLGALEPAEFERVELHLLACDRCRALVDEERVVAGLFPYLAPAEAVPLRVRHRLLDAVERQEPVSLAARRNRIPTRMLRLSWLAAGLAAVLALGFFWHGTQIQQQVDQKDTQLVTLESQQDTVLAFVSTHGGFVTQLQDSGAANGAHGGVIVDPNGTAAVMMVDGLPQPRPGHAYLVWAVRGSEQVNAGLLPVDKTGHAVLRIVLPESLLTFDSLIITDESGPAVAFPTGTRLMSAHVSH